MSRIEPNDRKAALHGPPPLPWWRVRLTWLVIGGPLVVVVASFATLAAALRHPDPVIASTPTVASAELPAVQGRNHAATPRR